MSTLWQYMISTAFRRGHYDGVVTIRELKKRGDHGLGEYAALDGELIVVDGEFYRARSDGTIQTAVDDDPLCFAQVATLGAAEEFAAPDGLTLQNVATSFAASQRTRNTFYLITIEGDFETVTTTVFPPQQKPYPPLAEANAQAVKFRFKLETGKLVGFFSPTYMRDVGVPGYHLHFLNDQRTGGGHVTSFELRSGRVSLQPIDRFSLVISQDEDFLHADLEL
ncbi:acetolactate decarboxylase [Singulisphaera sp. GP187]|uniref:acetolactate decarboxylase n=1 Tax=Singulisphaera sp. GP187 TaxID=1882752 RepID=UPI0009294E00|nr:acetolactate decarboxylase [Singulisphaera sp. GP187]SIO26847.1 acetolactate decarboxylase [Singulisphaera sp. GP187]